MGNTVSSIALPVILVYSNDATRCLEVSMEKSIRLYKISRNVDCGKSCT